MPALLELDHIECRHRRHPVVRDLSLQVRRGSLACLLGPSGCGKTTILRAIAGFDPIHSGEIRIGGELVSRRGFTRAPEHRRVGMVFQDYALFPHLDVTGNVRFGLRGQGARAARRIAREVLEVVGLSGYGHRYPHELSGGQQQRVALARALAPRPDLMLLDEPFSSLDVDLRERLANEVREILEAQDITGVLVTHDQHEAFAVAEHIGVIRDGRMVQWDSAYSLYHEPVDRFVADFIGSGCLIAATLRSPHLLDTAAGTIRANRPLVWPPGTRLEVLLRPDDVLPDESGPLAGRIVRKAFKGAQTLYTLRLDNGTEVLSLFPSHLDYGIDDRVGIRIAAEHLVAFTL